MSILEWAAVWLITGVFFAVMTLYVRPPQVVITAGQIIWIIVLLWPMCLWYLIKGAALGIKDGIVDGIRKMKGR